MKQHPWMARILIIFGVLTFFLPLSVAGQEKERILFFDSYIRIHTDGSMTVTETIRVYAAGRQIKRGIYRDFPTRYTDRFGNIVRVGFQVQSVLRDGRPEAFHLKKIANGIRVYMGEKNRRVGTGEHGYTITYRTDRQLGHFGEFDELYWNVTGNGWSFSMDQVRAVIELPGSAEVLEVSAYTGPEGARGQDFTMSRDDLGRLHFATTRPLRPREGLTVAVSWPKGFVPVPGFSDKVGYLLSDNPAAMAAVSGMILLMAYYLTAWFKIGRDPEKGPIIPLFSPPEGFTPAAVRFVTRMGFDHKSFASAVVNMAVKGFLNIQEEDGEYTLSKTGADESLLSKGERRIARKLFGGTDHLVLDTANHRKIGNAVEAFKKRLKIDFEKLYFQRNSKWLVPGWVISLIILAFMVLSAPEIGAAVFMLVWLSIWTLGCATLVLVTVKAWQGAASSGGTGGFGKKLSPIGITLFTLPFVGFEFFGIWALSSLASPFAVVALILIIGVNFVFYHLMKAPTVHGRKVMDRIEGFKRYLSVAEKHGLDLRNPPEKTPELFEKFLPYALALDVENQWSQQFADILTRAGQGTDYTPSWYTGGKWHRLGAAGMANSLGSSFSSAISASSSPPGSSSGGGGGGSSGGGGGGGGGGGW